MNRGTYHEGIAERAHGFHGAVQVRKALSDAYGREPKVCGYQEDRRLQVATPWDSSEAARAHPGAMGEPFGAGKGGEPSPI